MVTAKQCHPRQATKQESNVVEMMSNRPFLFVTESIKRCFNSLCVLRVVFVVVVVVVRLLLINMRRLLSSSKRTQLSHHHREESRIQPECASSLLASGLGLLAEPNLYYKRKCRSIFKLLSQCRLALIFDYSSWSHQSHSLYLHHIYHSASVRCTRKPSIMIHPSYQPTDHDYVAFSEDCPCPV